MKNKRRGFTIVELVIVIAVIGILSAILIPTFIGLTNRANEASNVSFVKSLNTKLAINDAMADTDPHKVKLTTYGDVVDFSAENGFDVRKLTPVDDNELLYDMENNRFVIGKVNGDNIDIVFKSDAKVTDKAHNLWYICKDGNLLADEAPVSTLLPKFAAAPAARPYIDQGCSVYLADAAFKGAIKVKSGFDAGDNNSLSEVKYDRQTGAAQEVILNLKSGTVNVTTNLDTVTVYGSHSTVYSDANNGTITIKSNAEAYVELTFGNIKFENKATENAVVIAEGVTDTSAFTVTAVAGAAVPTFYVPDDAPAAVKEAAAEMGGTTVEELQPADARQTVKTFEELSAIVDEVNAGTLDNPTVFLGSPTYQFTKQLELKKSITIKGDLKTTVFKPYGAVHGSTSRDNHAEAFWIDTKDSPDTTINLEGFTVDHFGCIDANGNKIVAGASDRNISFIRYTNSCEDSTTVNVKDVYLNGSDRTFIDALDTYTWSPKANDGTAGTINLTGVTFDGTDRLCDNINALNVLGKKTNGGDYRLKVTVDNCDFRCAQALYPSNYGSTAICVWGNADVEVRNSRFVDCEQVLYSGNASYWWSVDRYNRIAVENSKFTDCEAGILLDDFEGHLSDYNQYFANFGELEVSNCEDVLLCYCWIGSVNDLPGYGEAGHAGWSEEEPFDYEGDAYPSHSKSVVTASGLTATLIGIIC